MPNLLSAENSFYKVQWICKIHVCYFLTRTWRIWMQTCLEGSSKRKGVLKVGVSGPVNLTPQGGPAPPAPEVPPPEHPLPKPGSPHPQPGWPPLLAELTPLQVGGQGDLPLQTSPSPPGAGVSKRPLLPSQLPFWIKNQEQPLGKWQVWIYMCCYKVKGVR